MKIRRSFNGLRYVILFALLGSGMLGLSSFFSSADFLSDLQVKYDRFIDKYPVVRITMAFNQPAYAPGDTIFFKAWYQTESRSPVKGTHVITADIISGEGKTIQKTRFKARDGSGFNQIILGDNIMPGLYKIVGYSDWMKNFGETWYFTSDLMVTRNRNIEIVESNPEKKLQFFVEGGKAIANVVNRFVVTGAPHSHFNVLDDAGKSTAIVDIDSTGVGIFEFRPEAGKNYHVYSENQSWALPPLEMDGVSLRLDKNASIAYVTLSPTSKLSGDELFAVCLKNGKIILKKSFSITSEVFELPLVATTSDGYNQLFIFSKGGDVLAHRVFLSAVEKKLEVKIQFPEKLNQRSDSEGTILITDNNGNGLESDLTVSIFQQDLFEPSSGVFYKSDLPEADAHFNKYPKKSVYEINNFLVTQSWDHINWKAILSDKELKISFPYVGQFGVKGTVHAKEGVSEIPDSTLVIAYLQENTIGYEGYTRNGKFVIPFVLDFFGKDKVFFTLENKKKILDEAYEISIQSDSINLSSRWRAQETTIASRYGTYATKRGIVARSYSFFQRPNGDESVGIENPNRFFEDEFLGTDFNVNVSEYVIFPTMIELVREVVPFVQHRKKKSGDELRLSYRRENTTHVFARDPLFVMDGAMTRNTSFFLSLKPEDLLYLKLINNPNKLSQLGKLGENGIIFIESKKGDLASKITASNYFEAIGLNRAIAFPVRGVEKTTRPDLRSTLYWNPSMKTDKTGLAKVLFSTSDDIGPMKIVVKGITKEGIPFTEEKVFYVDFNNQLK